jgi:hypothetical protein
MITIKVLGTGCHNCLELEKRLFAVITKLSLKDVHVERIDDERTIRHYIPLEAIPGLLIDGRLVSEREVPDLDTLENWLRAVPA